MIRMANTISTRIHDYLKDYPPFSLLDPHQLAELSASVTVQYCRPNEVIFRQGEKPEQRIFVVREGAVQMVRQEDDREILVEQCDEGDVFGIRPLINEDNYALTAKAVEETLLYVVNVEKYRETWNANPKIAHYLASSFAEGLRRNYDTQFKNRLFLDQDRYIDGHFHLVEVQSLEYSKAPVTCPSKIPIQIAAGLMAREEVSSIVVVDEKQHPIGIITDKDLRRKVATGLVPIHQPVEQIMAHPVVTSKKEMTVADAQMDMVKHRIHHLVMTEDGTPDTPVVGVISEHDLLVVQGNNPAVMIREIRRSRKAAELKNIRQQAESLLQKYLYQEVSISYISSVMTEINDALITQVIRLCEETMEEEAVKPPGVPYCWLTLGSEGREEQLLRTDQDSALLFGDVPEEEYPAAKAYFLTLAGRVSTMLNECGFDYCPGDMMASNAKWCLSLSEWKEQFGKWIFEPIPEAILHCEIFFDFRPVYGDSSLAAALTDHIFESVGRQTIFLSFLAKAALQNPAPLTFFRGFVVERSGEHKDEFDIKARAMMPLADAARVLILSARVGRINNTIKRFEKLAELEPSNAELFQQAADSYGILMRYRALQGIRNRNSGRYFNPSELSKMERINLRNSFQPIQELQSLLNMRYQLAYMR